MASTHAVQPLRGRRAAHINLRRRRPRPGDRASRRLHSTIVWNSADEQVRKVEELLVCENVDAWPDVLAAVAAAPSPVVASIGSLILETPTAWTIACLLLWIVFFPMYLAARSKT